MRSRITVFLILCVADVGIGIAQTECPRVTDFSCGGPSFDVEYLWPMDRREFLVLTYIDKCSFTGEDEIQTSTLQPLLMNGIYGLFDEGASGHWVPLYRSELFFLVIAVDMTGNVLVAKGGWTGQGRPIDQRGWMSGLAPANLCRVVSWDFLQPTWLPDAWNSIGFTVETDSGERHSLVISFRWQRHWDYSCPDAFSGPGGSPSACWEGNVTVDGGVVDTRRKTWSQIKGQHR